jgi:hypothetical protein
MSKTDYTHTNNPRSIHLAEMAAPFPDWIKGSPIPSKDGLEKLASVAFADRANRLLPLHSKEATFFSAVDYFANVDSYPERTFEAIKEACDHFDIGADVAPYAEFFSGVFEKKASDSQPVILPGKFAINTTLNGKDFRLLPLDDAYEISKSARDLTSMVEENRIHYLMFVDAAREIVKAAAEAAVVHELPGLVVEVGTPRFEDLDKAASLIESRRSLCDQTAFDAYSDALKEAAAGEITADDCMRKIAATDSAIGLRYNFNPRRVVPLPHDIVFTGPSYAEVEKLARERVMVRGVPVPLEAVRKIDKLDVEFNLEKAAAATLLQLRDGGDAIPLSHAVSEWPETDQKLLLKLSLDANP